ncbi:hypothetical protein [Streptomyces pilosus]|uniref:hypothetical protein n=1 Tax=Streptomyces pilosus TaxID=28893 RepID=UPI00359AB353
MRLRSVLAGAALGSALLVGGFTTPVQAASDGAPTDNAGTAAAEAWYLYDYYYWKSDCVFQGRTGLQNGWWTAYECRNGSWVPGDDYELWVNG